MVLGVDFDRGVRADFRLSGTKNASQNRSDHGGRKWVRNHSAAEIARFFALPAANNRFPLAIFGVCLKIAGSSQRPQPQVAAAARFCNRNDHRTLRFSPPDLFRPFSVISVAKSVFFLRRAQNKRSTTKSVAKCRKIHCKNRHSHKINPPNSPQLRCVPYIFAHFHHTKYGRLLPSKTA